MSAKSRKVSCPVLPYFERTFRIYVCIYIYIEWAYFLRLENVNFTKTCFLKTRLCTCINMQKWSLVL